MLWVSVLFQLKDHLTLSLKCYLLKGKLTFGGSLTFQIDTLSAGLSISCSTHYLKPLPQNFPQRCKGCIWFFTAFLRCKQGSVRRPQVPWQPRREPFQIALSYRHVWLLCLVLCCFGRGEPIRNWEGGDNPSTPGSNGLHCWTGSPGALRLPPNSEVRTASEHYSSSLTNPPTLCHCSTQPRLVTTQPV